MNDKAVQDLVLLGLLVIAIALILELTAARIFNHENKKNKKVMKKNKPIYVELYDVLIIFTRANYTRKKAYYFLPILKDKNNNLYIQSKYNHYGYLYPQYAKKISIEEKERIICKNFKSEEVPFGKQGKLYISKEKDKIDIFDNMIHIEGENYIYTGKFEDMPEFGYASTIRSENILNELNGATIYLGVTDFDKDGVIKENLERASWWKK